MTPNLPAADRKRKHRSLQVERDACLYALGIDPTKPWEIQHSPPLALRPFIPELDDYDPPENSPRHMFPLQQPDHAKITKEVDRPAIDKARRQAKGELRHLAAIAEKGYGIDEALARVRGRKRAWPKGKMRSRGFEKRRK